MNYIVLDTNILLLDATNLIALGQREDTTLVLPETVVDEIDSKKEGLTELAYQARQFARLLSSGEATKVRKNVRGMTITHIDMDSINLQVVSVEAYPDYTGVPDKVINDRKIIEVGLMYQSLCDNRDNVVFMTNDVMCGIRAGSLGLKVTDLKSVEKVDFEFTKTVELELDAFNNVHDVPILDVDSEYKPENYNYLFTCPDTNQVKLAYISQNKAVKIIGKDTEKDIRNQPLPPLNHEQLMLSRAILDPNLDIVVCEAKAGSGKTVTALSGAMKLVSRNSPYESITYIRASVDDVDKAEEVGFLPGLEEKFAVYLHPLDDTLELIARKANSNSKVKGQEYEDLISEYMVTLRAKYNITGMTGHGVRGRTFTGTVAIIEEAQNMSKASLQKVLTRFGKDCKIIIIGSNRQIDNTYINKFNNGLSVVLNDCAKDSSLVTKHAINLHKVVRSPIAEWAENTFTNEKDDDGKST